MVRTVSRDIKPCMDCGEPAKGAKGRRRLCLTCRGNKYRPSQHEANRRARVLDRERVVAALAAGEMLVESVLNKIDQVGDGEIGIASPVESLPGTNGRIAAYQVRVAKRLEVFHPLDRNSLG